MLRPLKLTLHYTRFSTNATVGNFRPRVWQKSPKQKCPNTHKTQKGERRLSFFGVSRATAWREKDHGLLIEYIGFEPIQSNIRLSNQDLWQLWKDEKKDDKEDENYF